MNFLLKTKIPYGMSGSPDRLAKVLEESEIIGVKISSIYVEGGVYVIGIRADNNRDFNRIPDVIDPILLEVENGNRNDK